MAEVVSIGSHSWSLSEFLRHLPEPTEDCELAAAKARFIAAGLNAVSHPAAQQWLHYGIKKPQRGIYGKLAALVRQLLDSGQIVHFFFMHKSPGMRIRFASPSGELDQIRAIVIAHLHQWRSEGLLSEIVPGFYEAEDVLFGGPRSMGHVHRLFTIDSLTWLDYHCLDQNKTPPWAFSLLMLKTLFHGLDIIGWEDRGVWTRVREIGGRRLPEIPDQQTLSMASRELQRWWMDTEGLTSQLSEEDQCSIADYNEAATLASEKWFSDYFSSDTAVIGPREAASYYVIFHWNRAGLRLAKQALITEALAAESHITAVPDVD